MTVDEATAKLRDAGFDAVVGKAVSSDVQKGLVAEQNPGPGKVAGGTTVTISPSNGQGISVPDVSGMSLDRAIAELRQSGFGNVQAGRCKTDADAGGGGRVINTDPKAGSVINRNSSISVNYGAPDCKSGRGND
jgi:beta-lactam-binding protein with PASTA domain